MLCIKIIKFINREKTTHFFFFFSFKEISYIFVWKNKMLTLQLPRVKLSYAPSILLS